MKFRWIQRNIPFTATLVVCLVLYLFCAFRYEGFSSLRVFLNLFGDNAFLGIAAVGMTFVILSGGIDLSVGGMIGLVSICLAQLVEAKGFHLALAAPMVLLLGVGIGALTGFVIHRFALPPFLVTLAVMFLTRGTAYILSLESHPINKYLSSVSEALTFSFGKLGTLSSPAVIFLIVLVVAVFVAHYTRFGRHVYAVGSSETSAQLMGLPVGSTKVAVYALSGFCSALAGIVYSLFTFSGNPNAANGLELDAIAAVVIGGTLLTGGVGYVAGTLLGILIYGIIQTAIVFEGTLSSWWTRIFVGALLLFFILLQKVLQTKKFKTARTFQVIK
jgi:galactofuranose transport system permease protein